MDTEEGVEVVWNEVMFSERKNFKLQEVAVANVATAVDMFRWRYVRLRDERAGTGCWSSFNWDHQAILDLHPFLEASKFYGGQLSQSLAVSPRGGGLRGAFSQPLLLDRTAFCFTSELQSFARTEESLESDCRSCSLSLYLLVRKSCH
ncbi:nuclear receptor-binding protein [Lates japonicus]|uniref:Nuclear receptor-binding protein n=1 Tax=Lates japonicus TaxID=270547 RepID=A0AAD3NBN3_LATJO|nr:nuclear receptor-binding protein [Lates japonicus]